MFPAPHAEHPGLRRSTLRGFRSTGEPAAASRSKPPPIAIRRAAWASSIDPGGIAPTRSGAVPDRNGLRSPEAIEPGSFGRPALSSGLAGNGSAFQKSPDPAPERVHDL